MLECQQQLESKHSRTRKKKKKRERLLLPQPECLLDHVILMDFILALVFVFTHHVSDGRVAPYEN